MFQITSATHKIRKLSNRIRIIQGGSSASKTISVLLYLIDKAQRDETGTLTSIVSESLPHLKRGAMLDFLNIMQQHNYFVDARWNKSDYTYTFETGSRIEFFSIDQPRKVRGPRRDRLFINEANNTPFESFEQLEIRTKEFVILDYNPTNEFWALTEVMGKRTDVDFIILTYKDNEALDQSIVQSLEQRKNRKEWWKVYGLGQLGEVEGKIYKGWEIIDDVPEAAELKRKGLDYGYSNDPSSLIDLYKYNGGFIVDELIHMKGLSNKQIADTILGTKQCLVVADSAEPKSNDEIRSYGVNIIGAEKGKDSVSHGIQMVQDQKVYITKRSVNVIHEYRNYLWMTDKDGKILNEPEHTFSHSMDAIRYAIVSLVKLPIGNARQFMPNHVGATRKGSIMP